MAVTRAFIEAVNTGDVLSVRIMIKNSLLVDPTFVEVLEMEKVSLNMDGLYDEYDGVEFIHDKTLWNEDYMNDLMVQIIYNFSHERLEHLKEVVRYLEKSEIASVDVCQSSAKQEAKKQSPRRLSYEEQKTYDKKNGTYLGAKVGAGAVVGAVIGGIAAYAIGVTMVGGAVVGGVIGGATAYTVNKDGR